MVFICAQPDDKYFAWQVEVLINNFRKFGYSDKMHILLYKPSDRKNWNADFDILETRYPEVKFFRYEDKGAMIKAYIPILRPHILKQHFQAHPELEKETIFYHDCDILLTRELDLETLEQGDTWFMSDTNSYISYDYFASKVGDVKPAKQAVYSTDKLLEPILSSVGITVGQFKQNNGNAGGAQYILKGVNAEFWEKVEKDAINIYLYFKSQNLLYFPNEDKGIQRWCADMWSVLWNGIRLNKDIKITKELDFSWATDKIEAWSQKPIYHNAGVVGNEPHLFYKGKFHNNATTPFHEEITGISKDYASYMYFQEIQEVKDKYYHLVT
jgi:hypothetical protein